MQAARRRGGYILSIEALMGFTLLFSTFIALMFLQFRVWIQLRAEDTATQLVREATRLDRAPGDTQELVIFDGNGTASIEWTDEYVQVTVDVKSSWHRAVRVLPREVL